MFITDVNYFVLYNIILSGRHISVIIIFRKNKYIPCKHIKSSKHTEESISDQIERNQNQKENGAYNLIVL